MKDWNVSVPRTPQLRNARRIEGDEDPAAFYPSGRHCCWALPEIQGHLARSPPLAKSVAKIRFEPRPIKMGSGWLVIVRFPDQPEIEVPGFATEADAQNWVTNDSWAWLNKLGYGD